MVFAERPNPQSRLIRRKEFFEYFSHYLPWYNFRSISSTFPFSLLKDHGVKWDGMVYNWDLIIEKTGNEILEDRRIWLNSNLNEEFLEKHKSYIRWDFLSRNPHAPISFMLKNKELVDWDFYLACVGYEKYLLHRKEIDWHILKKNIYNKTQDIPFVIYFVLAIVIIMIDVYSKFADNVQIHEHNKRPFWNIRTYILFFAMILFIVRKITFSYTHLLDILFENRDLPDSFFKGNVKFLKSRSEMRIGVCFSKRTSFAMSLSYAKLISPSRMSDEELSLLIMKFFREGGTWDEFQEHPYFSPILDRLINYTDDGKFYYKNLPRKFIEIIILYSRRNIYDQIVVCTNLDDEFWETHWRKLTRKGLEDFLRFTPKLTLNFVVRHFDEIVTKLMGDANIMRDKEEAQRLIIRTLAFRELEYQYKLERYEYLIATAKRHFLHQRYSPFTMKGQQRLLDDFSLCCNSNTSAGMELDISNHPCFPVPEDDLRDLEAILNALDSDSEDEI